MAVKLYKPTSAGRRIQSVTDYSVLQKNHKTPKSLVLSKARPAGRNNSGKITVRHQGGGARRKVRLVDFSRQDKKGILRSKIAFSQIEARDERAKQSAIKASKGVTKPK